MTASEGFHAIAVDAAGRPVKDVGPSRGLPVYANLPVDDYNRDTRAIALSKARGWAEGVFEDYPDAARVHVYGPVRLDQPREDGDPCEVIDRPTRTARCQTAA